MAASGESPLSDAERAFLRELTRGGTKFMVVGLGAAVLQGADTATQDLDLWFESLADPTIEQAARAAGGVFAGRANPPVIAGEGFDHIDLVIRCDGLESFAAEYVRAIDVALDDFSIKVLPLERVIASKQAAGRPKDTAVLPALNAALATRRTSR